MEIIGVGREDGWRKVGVEREGRGKERKTGSRSAKMAFCRKQNTSL